MNISKKITLLIVVSLLIIGCLSIFISAYSLRKRGKEEIEYYQKEIYRQKQQSLKNLVDTVYIFIENTYKDSIDSKKIGVLYKEKLKDMISLAYGVLDAIHDSAGMNEDEKKAAALFTISQLRYGHNDYFWINDTHPKMIMHPFKMELNEKDLSNFKDPNGKKLFVEMAKIALSKGEGTVDYMWPKPGRTKPVPKISYVKLFKPWNWIIGTGVYIETAEEELKRSAAKVINSLRYGIDKKDYFYIFNSRSHIMTAHPKSDLIGVDINSDAFRAPNGKNPLPEQLQIALKSGEGVSFYKWPKLGHEKFVFKMTYFRLFKPWNWVVATGVYMDDVESAIAAKKQGIEKDVWNQTFRMAGITSLFTLSVVFFVILLSRRNISNPIQEISNNLNTCSEIIDSASNSVFSSSEELASRASEQASNVEEISSALEELSAMTRRNSEHSISANQSRKDAEASLKSAGSLVKEATKTMSEADSKSREMVKIINTIDDITFQTNLLAINAAIEAARAGESGSGFAVVAEEVRNLSRRTAHEAQNIQQLIEETVKEIVQGVDKISKTSEAFDKALIHTRKVAEMINEIARASQEQAFGIEEINSAVSEINQMTQRNADNAESFVSTAQHMSDQADSMNTAMDKLAHFIGKQRQFVNEKNGCLTKGSDTKRKVRYITEK